MLGRRIGGFVVAMVVAGVLAGSAVAQSSMPGQSGGQGPMSGSGPMGGPPPEALAACSGLSAGAACSFQGRQGQVSGTCFQPSTDRPLGCRPSNPPGGQMPPAGMGPGQMGQGQMGQGQMGQGQMGQRMAPPEAKAACANAVAGSTCSFTGPQGQTMSGTCNTAPDDQAMACRPAR